MKQMKVCHVTSLALAGTLSIGLEGCGSSDGTEADGASVTIGDDIDLRPQDTFLGCCLDENCCALYLDERDPFEKVSRVYEESCCSGRPLVVNGAIRVADLRVTDEWLEA